MSVMQCARWIFSVLTMDVVYISGYYDSGIFFCQFRLLTRKSLIGQFIHPVGFERRW